jgi:hypothetical protein
VVTSSTWKNISGALVNNKPYRPQWNCAYRNSRYVNKQRT